MYRDLTLKISPEMMSEAVSQEKLILSGHLGTHFDVMDKEFPLEYVRRKAVIFDVSEVKDREIGVGDIDLNEVKEDMFIGFHTGFIEEKGYGTPEYHKNHPELSFELIEALLERKISLIGIDFPGVRRGREHTPTDQHCADRGVFIIENLCNMKEVTGKCEVIICPMNFSKMSGLPCRVIAET